MPETSTENHLPAPPIFASDPEVVFESLRLSDYANASALDMRNREKKEMEKSELEVLSYKIRECAGLAEEATRNFLGDVCIAVLNAWTCGCALNSAKKRLKHGEFLDWFAKEFTQCEDEENPLSLRTAQRYMKLARKFPTAEKVIGSSPSLRQAYQACGILPPLTETEKPTEKGSEAAARVRLLRSVTGVRSTLQRFSQKKHALDESTRKELMDAKTDIDQLFASLIG